MGTETVVVDATKPGEGLTDEQRRERGDIIDGEAPPADADNKSGAKAGDDGDGGDDDPLTKGADKKGDEGGADDDDPEKTPAVPYGRFKEVNDELQTERETRIRLEERLAASKPADKAAEEAKPVDIKALRKEANRKLLEGDEDGALEIQEQIDTEIQRRATIAATEDLEQRNAVREINDAAERVVEKYPFLNSRGKDANGDAIEEVVVWRNHYIGQGLSPAKALEKAANKVGPMYEKREPDDKSGAGGDDAAKKRQEHAITRNANHENRQPAQLAGKGDRSKGTVAVDVANLSDKQFREMPDDERRRARGDVV